MWVGLTDLGRVGTLGDMKIAHLPAVIATLTAVAFSPAVFGQGDVPATSPIPSPGVATREALERREEGVRASLEFTGSHAFRTDLSDGPGEVAVTQAGSALSLGYNLGQNLILSGVIGADMYWYNFNNASGIIPGAVDPVNQFEQLFIRPQLIYAEPGSQYAYILGGQVTYSGESGADFSDSLTGNAFGAVQYRVSDSFNFTVGVGVSTRLEDSLAVIPIVGFEWKISEQTTLATRGIGLRFTQGIAEGLRFVADGEYQIREFRLGEDAPQSGGAFRDKNIPVMAGVVWSPSKNIDVTLRAGAVVWQEFEVYNKVSNKLSDNSVDVAPMVSLGLEWSF